MYLITKKTLATSLTTESNQRNQMTYLQGKTNKFGGFDLVANCYSEDDITLF